MRLSIALGIAAFVIAAALFLVTTHGRIPVYGATTVYWSAIRSAFYIGLAVGGCAYAIRCGGAPERIAGVVILATLAAHPLMHLVIRQTFDTVDPVHLLIDLVRFVAFAGVSLVAYRFWPLWFTGFQLLALTAHPAKAMDLNIHPLVYGVMLAMWTYGMLVLLILATRHHQRVVARDGTRASWSDFSRRWGLMRRITPND